VSKGLVAFLFALSIFPLGLHANVERLPYPRALYHKVEFWKLIYTKYSTLQGILHDSEDPSIIYEEIDLPRNGSQSIVGQRRAVVREALFGILRKRGQNLTSTERKVMNSFPRYSSRSRLLQATENIRFQLGQSDRFKAGVIRSGRFLKYVEQVIKEEKMPEFLKYLPHVESSYYPYAFSKVGAAGLWQIMPTTGRNYNLRVDYAVDQRLDPLLATRAAIRFLRDNYQRLKEWPLAITAYNHGPGGVARAVKDIGSSDIAEIAFQYSSPSFGFASRNFYPQFLAAVQVAQDYKKYFGDIELDKPFRYEDVKLEKETYFRTLASQYKMTTEEWKLYNPSLRPPVFENRRPIPKGVLIRVVPGAKGAKALVASLDPKAIKDAAKIQKQETKDKILDALKISSPQSPTAGSKKSSKDLPPVPSLSAITGEKSKLAGVPNIDELMGEPKYSVKDVVSSKGWIRVEINETISQVAEWLNVDVEDLRKWNAIEERGQARLGQRLIVRLNSTTKEEFETQREDYHAKIREDFFSSFQVDQFVEYQVKAGENLWSICFQKFDIPPWLLEQFNPEVVLWDLKPGIKLRIPTVKESNPAVADQSAE
jgi:membrane-bound lytic murein transglycosylase D